MTAVLLDGVAFGLQLSLLAVGMTMIYGLGGVLNLAHGQLAAAAAVVGAALIDSDVPLVLGVGIGVLLASALALALDATVLRPVYRLAGEPRVLLSLLVTLGIASAVDGILIRFAPFTLLNLPVPGPALELMGVPMRRGTVLAAVIAVAVLATLIVVLRSTVWGRAVRASIQDEEGAALCGIDPARIRRSVFVLGGGLAGLVAVTQGLVAPIGATSGRDLTVLALIVTVVGGLGRVSGALLAGLALGVVHAFVAATVGAFLPFVVLLLVAMVVILIRPSGIVPSAR